MTIGPMKLPANMFRTLLDQLDPEEMAYHSSINHHIDGLDYLCLLRTDKFTVKAYLMEKPDNPNNGYLVNPHSHRYAFATVVLAGWVSHLRFKVRKAPMHQKTDMYTEHRYIPDIRKLMKGRDTRLTVDVTETFSAGGEYVVNTDEVHTLRMIGGRGPALLGLVQFEDELPTSRLYLPQGQPMALPHTRQPSVKETDQLRRRIQSLL